MAIRPTENTDRTLWMGDLDPHWDSTFISDAFAKMGEETVNVKIVSDKYTGKPGYCFVEFADQDSARRAMLHINGKTVPKSRPSAAFNLSFANSPNAPYTEYNLFVNNVPHSVDDAALFLIFGERYQSCRGAKVFRNSDGSSKGLGFVRFSDQTDQQRALLEMNKYRVDGKQLILKLAQPKYRAPRPPRHPERCQRESTSGYYAAAQPYATAVQYYDPNILNTVQPQAAVPTAHQAYLPAADPVVVPSISCSVVVGGLNTGYDVGGLALVECDSPEKSNETFMKTSEEFYSVMEESRWSKIVLNGNTTNEQLLRAMN
ncbi:hypothetical protein AB6A40_003788 [Gnathostoma spinigerum]|uniref:tRNA selenocysteine-associated protein 1 n=1 Tax=Gnathostoma spinigerum TaxID=75299 RepID=A0ABD6EG31_9BILA